MPSRVLPFLDTFLSFPTRGVARIALTDRGVTPRFDRRRHRFVHRSRMDDDRTSAGPVTLAMSTAWVRVPVGGGRHHVDAVNTFRCIAGRVTSFRVIKSSVSVGDAHYWDGFDSRRLHKNQQVRLHRSKRRAPGRGGRPLFRRRAFAFVDDEENEHDGQQPGGHPDRMQPPRTGGERAGDCTGGKRSDHAGVNHERAGVWTFRSTRSSPRQPPPILPG
jgi:hypothetical protein